MSCLLFWCPPTECVNRALLMHLMLRILLLDVLWFTCGDIMSFSLLFDDVLLSGNNKITYLLAYLLVTDLETCFVDNKSCRVASHNWL